MMGMRAKAMLARAGRHVAASALMAATTIVAATAVPTAARAQAARDHDIPAGPLAASLNRFGDAAGIKLFYDAALTANLSSPGLKGRFSAPEALSRLLAGSGLTFRQTGAAAFTLERAPQASGGAIQLGPVRVEGQGAGGSVTSRAPAEETATSPINGYIAKRTATATRTDTLIADVPQSISIIGAQQIRDQRAMSLPEALRYTAGVRAEANGLNSRSDSFRLRGGSEGSTLLDSLRSSQSHPLDDYILNEPFAFERIEVLRGPSSVMSGQNGPGGVVNLVSKRPYRTPYQLVEGQIGSREHKQISIDVSGPAGDMDGVFFRVSSLIRKANFPVNFASNDRMFVSGSFLFDLGVGSSLTIYGEYQKDDLGNTIAYIPYSGTILGIDQRRVGQRIFVSEPDWDFSGGARIRTGYEMRHELSDRWSVSHNLRYSTSKGGYRSLYPAWWEGFHNAAGEPDVNGNYLKREIFSFDSVNRSIISKIDLTGTFTTGPFDHRLTFGADGGYRQARYGELSGVATPLDVFNPVYGTFAEPAFPNKRGQSASVRMAGAFVQNQFTLAEKYVFLAAVRRDWARTSSNGQVASVAATSVNLGAVVHIDDGWAPYASYTQSFEPVAGTDRLGRAFVPKRGDQVEAGLRWSPAEGLMISAAGYRIKERNRLATDPANPNYSIQRGQITTRGIEFEAVGRYGPWNFTGNYTYTKAGVTRTTVDDIAAIGKQLPGIPKHSAALWLMREQEISNDSRINVGSGVRYVGKSGDGNGMVFAPDNAFFDALFSYQRDNIRISVNATNLIDNSYYGACHYGYCTFGDRRRIILSIGYKFGKNTEQVN